MSKNKPFNDGIELLREVSQRKSSSTDEERKEVDEMMKKMAQEHKLKPSPIQMIKKKLTEINVSNITTSKGDVDRRLEFLENFEQSSKSG
eukprot:CAMPEP_0170952908 /NCGR_PEP_ID=MMETSP0735-20130129/31597_1 /TAXON_ID=186038 /ORGANISM="Fragilariopsis kerguelensis, Strain L26-C5" /LENGTH=89 /DNA_ID=CAMNT_0011364145 /DNA_START=262 /DNA_END=532 /DNA_ORIENTATION=+